MENVVTAERTPAIAEVQSVKDSDSAENFQKLIYQLFEKKGILNDLRAYLRGHIVNVLKSAETGDPPACQKHFTQRLDLSYQALNILIAEYLMRLEFSYSFSVFVSEIPLANMVFGFAKTLMQNSSSDENSEPRFNNTDVWSILNYLGIQCDCEHASNIVDMYKSDTNPLLLCILKCMPMYQRESTSNQHLNSSDESVSSADTLEDKQSKTSRRLSFHDKCKHYVFCKTCQNRVARLKEKYKRKKKYLAKNIKVSKVNPYNVENLMKNISVMERSLIDEMFEQLKTVYEAEVDMLRAEEEKRVKQSLAAHALQLQKRKDEMEESFRARELELERNIQQKKRFLWGLARSLRDQHARLAGAMRDLQAESSRLSDKEDSLKAQIAEAEDILKKRGEDMRQQISNELTILEGHLESMKKERDSINRERNELQQLKSTCDTKINIESHDLHSHYDLLKNELGILKKYLESSRLGPKCVIERSTVTDLSDVTSKLSVVLNNGQDLERNGNDSDERLKNQLVNDLKKKKNVNFSQSNLDEIYRDRSRERSRSSSSEAGDAAPLEADDDADAEADDAILHLREENDRLKTFARQQREHIDELSSAQARLQAELTATRFRAGADAATPATPATPAFRPRTAPTLMPQPALYAPGVSSSVSVNTSLGWRKGAGEELSVFSNAQPRILVPGDTLPFIGVLRDRHADNRRHLISQWRALRRRVSPLASGGVCKPRPAPAQRDRNIHDNLTSGSVSANHNVPQTSYAQDAQTCRTPNNNTFNDIRENLHHRTITASVTLDINKNREKSPKSVLREAKEKLRNKDSIKFSPVNAPREKSPNAVLREAKLRLRKLEIEAEAVEKSYLDFKKKQSEMRDERRTINMANESAVSREIIRDLDIRRSRSLQKLDDAYANDMEAQYRGAEKSLRSDFDKYIREYQAKFDFGERFRNRPTVADKTQPIPKVYADNNPNKHNMERANNDYIGTPMSEFRKLYQSERQFTMDASQKSSERNSEAGNTSDHSNLTIQSTSTGRKDAIRKAKHNKSAELEILKQNISKIYNLPDDNIEALDEEKVATKIDDNLLRVEIENANEANTKANVAVASCVDTTDHTLDANTTQMTFIVSPKRNTPRSNIEEIVLTPDRPKRSISPEQAAHLTRNDVLDAISNGDYGDEHVSSIQIDLKLSSKEVLDDSVGEYERDDYPDDFSADVDNYNSRSDYDNTTQLSLPKTSEDDENFWNS